MKTYHYMINGVPFVVTDSPEKKTVSSPEYNSVFRKSDGYFVRWGKTLEDDPSFCPIGPEILDLELSVGGCKNFCKFCYKGNTDAPPTNMTFETFKRILDSMSKVLTQIAFGITGIQTNPDFVKMMEYARQQGIIPNFTLSGLDLTDELARQCAKLVGAVAVSAYQTDKNVCYNAVQKFAELRKDPQSTLRQINVHLLVSLETLPFVYEVLQDRQSEPRLKDMNSIVFLGLKPKGRAKNTYHPVSTEEYGKLIDYCLERSLSIGFDSCSSPKFEHAIKTGTMNSEMKKKMIECSESCESSLFSSYINVFGNYCHCSFAENEEGQTQIEVGDDFLKNVWYSPEVIKFREKLINTAVDGCRRCTVFPEINV